MLLKRRSYRNILTSRKPASNSTDFLHDSFRYDEISELTISGGWGVDFIKKQSYLDKQARKILKVPLDYIPSLKDGYRFYAPDEMERATDLYNSCALGNSFKTEIKMRTYEGTVFYARAQGKAIKNEKGNIIGIRGVFQNIEVEKKQTLRLQESLKFIDGHNKWLHQLAHIVSRNLNAQICNLQLTSRLIDLENLTEDQEELMSNIKSINNNLECTLRHLNTIATLQSVDKESKLLSIQNVYNEVVTKIKESIYYQRAIFYTEFSEVEVIKYIPTYLKNILTHLIINALKNKHPEREIEINVFTYEEYGNKYLVVKDNGIGLSQQKREYLMSRTYKTYSYGEDKPGLGIFLIKSQVEAIGGSLLIESKEGKGAKFTVQIQ